MAIRSDEITSIIRSEIKGFDEGADVSGVGTIVEVGDGIAQVYGLSGALAQELLEFPNGIMGMAFNLEEETVGVLILGDYTSLAEGDQVKTTGRIVEVPVGDAPIGRVVNPLGEPIDGKGKIATTKSRPIERIAPGVIVRQPVDTPVQTGIKAIDSMIPIGRGQRELIIGDRQTGKTAIAIDTIINQKGQDLICIYVAIGQKQSTVAQVVAQLEESGAMEHTIVVFAGASDPAPLQYLAPYAGVAMGEQHCAARRRRRDIPGLDPDPVFRRQPQRLVIEPGIPGRLQNLPTRVGEVDEVSLQHEHDAQQRGIHRAAHHGQRF